MYQAEVVSDLESRLQTEDEVNVDHVLFPIREALRKAKEKGTPATEQLSEIGVVEIQKLVNETVDVNQQRQELHKGLSIGVLDRLRNKQGQEISVLFKLIPVLSKRSTGQEIVAVADGKIIGRIKYELNGTVANDVDKQVLTEYQGLGVSTKLFQYASEVLLQTGITEMTSIINVDNLASLNSRRWKGGLLDTTAYLTTWEQKIYKQVAPPPRRDESGARIIETNTATANQSTKFSENYVVTTHLDQRVNGEQVRKEVETELNLRVRLHFDENLPAEQQAAAFDAILKDTLQPKLGVHEKVLSTEETKIIESMRNNLIQKLANLGVPNALARAPSMQQIRFSQIPVTGRLNSELDTLPSGGASVQSIKLSLNDGTDPTSPQVIHTWYHEAGHFSADTSLKFSEHDRLLSDQTGMGYEKFSSEGSQMAIEGLWEETTADIFALYCNESNETVGTVYPEGVAFMLGFTSILSERMGISSMEAFKKIFVAKTTADQNFIDTLRNYFPDEFVNGLMDTRWVIENIKKVDDPNALVNLAKIGKFEAVYANCLDKMHTSSYQISDSIPEIKGSIRAIEIPVEIPRPKMMPPPLRR